MPERGELGGRLTVRTYLGHLARLGGAPGRESRLAKVEQVIGEYGLAVHADAAMRSLSKGTLKKVGIVQALLVPSNLLVLDEPTDGLDGTAIERLRGDLEAAVRSGCCVVAACHTADLDAMAVPTHPVLVDERGVSSGRDGGRQPALVHVVTARAGAGALSATMRADEVDDVLLDVLSSGGRVLSVRPLDGGGDVR